MPFTTEWNVADHLDSTGDPPGFFFSDNVDAETRKFHFHQI